MYNTTTKNFNRYHLEKLTDKEVKKYAKLLIKDASEKEKEMNKHDTYNNSLQFSSASQNVNYIIKHINERKILDIDFKYGVNDLQMYGCENIGGLIKYFK